MCVDEGGCEGVEMEGVVLLQDLREVRLGEVMGVAPCMSFSHPFSSLCKYCWNSMDETVKDTSACIKLCGQSVAMAYMNITTKLWLLSQFFSSSRNFSCGHNSEYITFI